MNENHKGMLVMLLCTVFWSIGGIFIKLLPWNPLVLGGFRALIAAGVLLFYLRIKRIPLRISKRSIQIGVALCGTSMSFVIANKLTTSANAIVLQQCAPVVVLLYSAFVRKQKFYGADYLVVLLTFLGIGVCFIDRMDTGSILGNLFGIAAGVFFAANFLFSADAAPEERPNGLFQGQCLTALIGVPFLLVFGAEWSGLSIVSILVLGVFQIGIPYILYAYAVQRAKPLTCSLLAVMEPVLNPIWVYLFDGEAPGIWSMIGGVLVVGSITLWCVYSEKTAAARALQNPGETA